MCKQLEDLRDQNVMETKIEMIVEMYAKGLSVDMIADIAKVSVEQVEAWIAESK